jgi:glycosyltransferase involved in cell wall biosynthesis
MVESLNKKALEEKFESTLFLPENKSRQGEGGLRTKGVLKHSFANEPLISIITAVYNGEKHLEETIQSIVNQTYTNMEYIIIDGGSTDSTLEIIKKYDDKIDYWVSEKDQGISDAFNKGVRLAQGQYVNFQGDGDGFIASDSLEKVFQDIHSDQDVFVSAKIKRIDVLGKEIFVSKQPKYFDKKSLLFRMSMPHQGLFTHIRYFKKYGLFDTKNTFSMDYEHLLRSYNEFPKVVLRDLVVAQWRADGLGNGRFLEIFREYDKIKRDNGVASGLILSVINCWILLKYSIKRIVHL